MNTSNSNYDTIEQLIFDEDIRIETVDFSFEKDEIVIALNTKAVLKLRLSIFDNLRNADADSLRNYVLLANGTGIHWPGLDEDLSLKGFLQEELRRAVGKAA